VEGTVPAYSDKPVTDVLVFERPVPAAKVLFLELPGENVGGNGLARFRIPVAKLQRTDR
jgi:hypothetical protein